MTQFTSRIIKSELSEARGAFNFLSICGPKRNLGLSVEAPRACRQEQKYSFCVCNCLSIYILSNQSEKIACWFLVYCSHMFMSFYRWNFEVQEQSTACRSSLLWQSAGCKAGRSDRLVLTGTSSVQTFGRRSPWLSFFFPWNMCTRVRVSFTTERISHVSSLSPLCRFSNPLLMSVPSQPEPISRQTKALHVICIPIPAVFCLALSHPHTCH